MPRPKSAVVVPAPTIRHRGPGRPSGTLEQSVNEAIVNAAVHHIVAVRRKRGGEITHVKHIGAGWLTVKEYYTRQKIHEILTNPNLGHIIRAGYELKAMLWGYPISLEIFGSGVSIPFGAFIAATELFEVEYLYQYVINPNQTNIAACQQQIAADQAQIAVIQANIIPTGAGKEHHQRSPGGAPTGYTEQEAAALIAALQADITNQQQLMAGYQKSVDAAFAQIGLLIAADILPFGDFYLIYHYGMLLYNLATGAIDDLEKFFLGSGTVVNVGGGWHFSSLPTAFGEFVQPFEQLGKWFESL